MAKVQVSIRAFNAEKTLRRAIESVLNQTFRDFTLIVLDNGSKDSTGEIAKEYAQKDERVIVWKNEINNKGIGFKQIFEDVVEKNYSYACILDSDDAYKPFFLEKAIAFAENNDLDVVIGGFSFIDSKTGENIETRKMAIGLPESYNAFLTVNSDEVNEKFIYYAQLLRAYWGKLYSARVLKQFKSIKKIIGGSFGADTAIVLGFLKYSNRIGVINTEVLDYFTNNALSEMNTFDKRRIDDINTLYDIWTDYIESKCGAVNTVNRDIINGTHFDNIRENIKTLLKSGNSFEEQLDLIYKSLNNIYTFKVFAYENLFDKTDDRAAYLKTLQKEISSKFNFKSSFKNKHNKKNKTPSTGFEKGGKIFETHESIKAIISLLDKLKISRIPEIIMKDASPEFCFEFKEIMLDIVQNDYVSAFQKWQAVDIKSVSEQLLTAFYITGEIITATTENAEGFIKIKKEFLAFLVEKGELRKARVELADFDELMPNDAVFKKFREILG